MCAPRNILVGRLAEAAITCYEFPYLTQFEDKTGRLQFDQHRSVEEMVIPIKGSRDWDLTYVSWSVRYFLEK